MVPSCATPPPTPRPLPPPPPSGPCPPPPPTTRGWSRDRFATACRHGGLQPDRTLAERERARPVTDADRGGRSGSAGRSASPSRTPRSPPTVRRRPPPSRRLRAHGNPLLRRPLARSKPRIRPSTPDATHTTPSAKASERGTLPTSCRSATLLRPGRSARALESRCPRPTASRRRKRAQPVRHPPRSSPPHRSSGRCARRCRRPGWRSRPIPAAASRRPVLADGDLLRDPPAVGVNEPDVVLVDARQPFGPEDTDDPERGDAGEH